MKTDAAKMQALLAQMKANFLTIRGRNRCRNNVDMWGVMGRSMDRMPKHMEPMSRDVGSASPTVPTEKKHN